MGIPRDSLTAVRLDQLIGTVECRVIVDVGRENAFDESDRMITTAEWRDRERAAEWAADLPDGAAASPRSAGVDAAFPEGGIGGFIEAGGETVAK